MDIPALSAHIIQLYEALVANGHSDSFLPQLHHISRVIGMPELNIRLTVLAAQSLFESGDFEGAVKEMKSLGDSEQLSDTLGLILITKLLDLPAHKQRQLLTRAVSGAFLEDEMLLAELELIQHLSDCGEQAEALQRIDTVAAKLMKMSAHRDLRARAISLKWYITREEQAFLAAKGELETFKDQEHRQRLMAMLIDHGDYDEAERILSTGLIATDLMAQLLIIDARVRANRIDTARELLLVIPPDHVPPGLWYPYAVTYALVALACADEDLKKIAATKLRQLPSNGTRIAKHVNDFMRALEGCDDSRQRSPLARICNLFTIQRRRAGEMKEM